MHTLEKLDEKWARNDCKQSNNVQNLQHQRTERNLTLGAFGLIYIVYICPNIVQFGYILFLYIITHSVFVAIFKFSISVSFLFFSWMSFYFLARFPWLSNSHLSFTWPIFTVSSSFSHSFFWFCQLLFNFVCFRSG